MLAGEMSASCTETLKKWQESKEREESKGIGSALTTKKTVDERAAWAKEGGRERLSPTVRDSQNARRLVSMPIDVSMHSKKFTAWKSNLNQQGAKFYLKRLLW